MKTISRIIVILMAMAIVAGAFFFAVNNSTNGSGPMGSGQPAAVGGDHRSNAQGMAFTRDGNHDSASPARGSSGVLVTLGKLAGITVIVLLVQKGFSLAGICRLNPNQRQA